MLSGETKADARRVLAGQVQPSWGQQHSDGGGARRIQGAEGGGPGA